MNIWIQAILFVVGVALIVKGGDIFVDAASSIAEMSGVPKFIIGATIVSVATTLPELIVSLIAAADGKVDMAIGNALGSVTANTGLILSMALIFMNVTAKRRDYLAKSLLLIAAAAILPLCSMTGALQPWGSIVLFIIFILFVYENIMEGKRTQDDSGRPAVDKKRIAKNIILFLVGAVAIVAGSRLLVNSGSSIAAFFGVPERIIAVTLVAVGTSLPELVTTITAIAKKQASLSAGNIIGANIIDLTLILPLCSLVSGQALPISAPCLLIDMPACLIVTLTALIPMLIGQKFYKWQGIVMLVAYAGYIIITV